MIRDIWTNWCGAETESSTCCASLILSFETKDRELQGDGEIHTLVNYTISKLHPSFQKCQSASLSMKWKVTSVFQDTETPARRICKSGLSIGQSCPMSCHHYQSCPLQRHLYWSVSYHPHLIKKGLYLYLTVILVYKCMGSFAIKKVNAVPRRDWVQSKGLSVKNIKTPEKKSLLKHRNVTLYSCVS